MMKEGSLRYILYHLDVGEAVEFSTGQYTENTIRHTASIFWATHKRSYHVDKIAGGWRVERDK